MQMPSKALLIVKNLMGFIVYGEFPLKYSFLSEPETEGFNHNY
jgi:hypothetical protein